MSWLNYHHLYYFWTVAREGALAPAAERLKLSPQTLSGQIRLLEASLDAPLFEKRGRRRELTEIGRVVKDYADEIFAIGRDLQEAVRGPLAGRPARLVVGVAEVVPKLVAKYVLEAVLEPVEGATTRLMCREDNAQRLLVELAAHRVDALVVDAPVPPDAEVRAFNHLLGESGVTFFSTPEAAEDLKRDFPRSLEGRPMLLPSPEAAVRPALDAWFEARGIRPQIVAEFDDSALLTVFGQDGHGVFPGLTALSKAIERQYGVVPIGQADGVRDRFYVVTLQRKLENPVIARLTEHARREIFPVELDAAKRRSRARAAPPARKT